MQTLKVRHNMEVAHRLFLTPGKCENIHGHSMWVVAELAGDVNDKGLLLGQDFGDIKAIFRSYLDKMYDHHLLLNRDDVWSCKFLPGMQLVNGDPTTENIARWIGEWCKETWEWNGLQRIKIEVWETQVNSATWEEVLNVKGITT
jgi:6-pyruvoyltetrahydropterin/6-carboxytetrahydropterin synthase